MKHFVASLAAAALAVGAGSAVAQDEMPFGSEHDVEYAELLWDAMESLNVAGEDRVTGLPYEGTQPHGMMLETFYTEATVDGHTGDLIVKNNYGPEGVTVDDVLSNPDNHLGAVTVMFRREEGYDSENQDWFWVRYAADGSIANNPDGVPMAGRVAAGMDTGCIACHQGAAGDLVFTSDHLAE